MATFYECDRCGDLYQSATQDFYFSSSLLKIDLDWDKTSVELCRECQKPFLVFLFGYLSKTNKNFRIDWNQEKIYNEFIK